MGRRGRRGAEEEDFDLEAFEAEQAALAGGGSGSGGEEEGSGSSDIDSSDLDSDEAAAVEAAVAAALAAEGLDDVDSEEDDDDVVAAAAAADQKDEDEDEDDDEEDDDAAPAPALTAAQKKRQRKKAAAQAKKAAAKASAAAAPPAAAAAAEPAAAEAAGGDEPLEPPAHLNAAQKKKWRQKQRAKAKKAAAKAGAASGGAAAAGGAAQPKKGAQPKQGGQRKGLSKGVAEALRAQREAQEAEEAAARKAAEEKAAAEAAAREAEEAEAERKRVAAAERRAKQKEKAAAKKAAAEKARVEAAKAARAAAGLPTGPAPKRVVYDSKKRKGKNRRGRFADDSDEEDEPAASSAGASAGAAAAAAKTDEAPKVSAGKAEEEPEQKDTGAAAASAADAAADADAADGAGGDEEPSWASWADADVDALLGEGDKDGGDDDAAAAEAAAAEAAAAEQAAAAEAAAGKEDADDNAGDGTVQEGKMRSPICVILGHVDTGKTKLLDKIRRTNVQDNEAGGITQQIGATFFPLDAIQKQTARLPEKVQAKLQFKIPGLLIIDTPGHESFANLRNRGSSLCDIAILVVDIMHGMEPQTLESINLLKMRKTPFVVALNKVDRLYDWEPMPGAGIQESLKSQKPHTVVEFERRSQEALGLFAEQGLNAALWWKNPDARKWVSVVPTSAHSGEGIPDLLMLICQLTQKLQAARLYLQPTLQCVILEVKAIDGLGTTIDVILVNGELTSNDEIVVCGFDGPIVTKVRALLTPAPMRELRVKSAYTHHKVIPAAMGIKIAAPNLENAVAGSSLFVAGPDSDIDELQDRVMEDLNAVMSKVDKEDRGVFVQASTLGSLEALLAFLKEEKVPVAGVNIGTVNRKDVVKASVMLEHAREYAVILAFDVKISADARAEAEKVGVTTFEADIIYHLTDMFTKHLETVQEEKRRAAAGTAVFPCVLKVLPEYVINKTDPIIIGVEIVEGTLRLRTPLAVPSQHGIQIGRVASIEFDHKQLDKAEKGQQVAVRIDPDEGAQKYSYGRHFGENDQLVSVISRRSIDLLVAEFRDEITRADKHLLQKLKKVFGVV